MTSIEYSEKEIETPNAYRDYDVVKTHLRPSRIKDIRPGDIVCCIVRDGRDSLVSMAHHRSDIVAPGSDFENNLEQAIVARKNSFFGGWGKNVAEWLSISDVVIRFEDLVADPIHEVERIRMLLPSLPQPDVSKLPTFDSQKSGKDEYGPLKGAHEKFFRKGGSGYWQTEMSENLQKVFWKKHGNVMLLLGYSKSGQHSKPLPIDDLRRSAKSQLYLKDPISTLTGHLPRRRTTAFSKRFSTEILYLKTQPNDYSPGVNILKDNIPKNTIAEVTFSQDGFATIGLSGKKINPARVRAIITNLPFHLISQIINDDNDTTVIAEIKHPHSMLLEAYCRSIQLPVDLVLAELNEKGKISAHFTPFIEYIKKGENRNILSKTLSPFSRKYVDIILNLSLPLNGAKILRDKFDWMINSPNEKETDHIIKDADVQETIQLYHKQDMALFHQLVQDQ